MADVNDGEGQNNTYEMAEPVHLCFNTKMTDLFDVVTKI